MSGTDLASIGATGGITGSCMASLSPIGPACWLCSTRPSLRRGPPRHRRPSSASRIASRRGSAGTDSSAASPAAAPSRSATATARPSAAGGLGATRRQQVVEPQRSPPVGGGVAGGAGVLGGDGGLELVGVGLPSSAAGESLSSAIPRRSRRRPTGRDPAGRDDDVAVLVEPGRPPGLGEQQQRQHGGRHRLVRAAARAGARPAGSPRRTASTSYAGCRRRPGRGRRCRGCGSPRTPPAADRAARPRPAPGRGCWAAAIFCRARVSRLAVAASVVSSTPAICAGDRPHSVRSARATRVVGDRAWGGSR